jgi:hypothetical protein
MFVGGVTWPVRKGWRACLILRRSTLTGGLALVGRILAGMAVAGMRLTRIVLTGLASTSGGVSSRCCTAVGIMFNEVRIMAVTSHRSRASVTSVISGAVVLDTGMMRLGVHSRRG